MQATPGQRADAVPPSHYEHPLEYDTSSYEYMRISIKLPP